MRKKTGAVLLITLMVVSTTTACTINRNDTNNDRFRTQNVRNDDRNDLIPDMFQTRNNGTTNGNNTNRGFNANSVRNMNGTLPNNAANRALADKIAKKAASIKGVDKATVVVNDKDALVGIDVKKGHNVQKTVNLVRNSVKNIEPGTKVHVSGDKNIHSRIRRLQTNLYGTNSTNGARNIYENNRLTQDNVNGWDRADGMKPRSVDGLDGTRMYNADGTDYLRHPIRSFANDVRDIIDDIGDVVAAPLRPLR